MHSCCIIFSRGKKVAVSIILAWIIGFGYTFSYSLGINKVLDGHCLVYYIPDEIWRKVLFFLASADSKFLVLLEDKTFNSWN